MDISFLSLTSALWLGILTSISPCPLATNVAAISFIGQRVQSTGAVLLAGILYTFGRILAYSVLAGLLVTSILSVPQVSLFLQKYLNLALGPILILAGMFLLELLKISIPGFGVSSGFQKRIESLGGWGALLLGILFALSFCPISAALFFGSLIPTCIQTESRVIIPAIYGIGTGLPVIVFAVAIAFGSRSLGIMFKRLSRIEFWARRITGVIFVAIGIYYTLVYMFKVL